MCVCFVFVLPVLPVLLYISNERHSLQIKGMPSTIAVYNCTVVAPYVVFYQQTTKGCTAKEGLPPTSYKQAGRLAAGC